ncbi:hypothetical protein C8F01DRAFT_1375663, partial [Mycena amicta]
MSQFLPSTPLPLANPERAHPSHTCPDVKDTTDWASAIARARKFAQLTIEDRDLLKLPPGPSRISTGPFAARKTRLSLFASWTSPLLFLVLDPIHRSFIQTLLERVVLRWVKEHRGIPIYSSSLDDKTLHENILNTVAHPWDHSQTPLDFPSSTFNLHVLTPHVATLLIADDMDISFQDTNLVRVQSTSFGVYFNDPRIPSPDVFRVGPGRLRRKLLKPPTGIAEYTPTDTPMKPKKSQSAGKTLPVTPKAEKKADKAKLLSLDDFPEPNLQKKTKEPADKPKPQKQPAVDPQHAHIRPPKAALDVDCDGDDKFAPSVPERVQGALLVINRLETNLDTVAWPNPAWPQPCSSVLPSRRSAPSSRPLASYTRRTPPQSRLGAINTSTTVSTGILSSCGGFIVCCCLNVYLHPLRGPRLLSRLMLPHATRIPTRPLPPGPLWTPRVRNWGESGYDLRRQCISGASCEESPANQPTVAWFYFADELYSPRSCPTFKLN